MNRATLTTALLTSFVCALSLACGADAPPQAARDPAPLAVEAAAPPSSSAAIEAPASSPEIAAPTIDEPILASTTTVISTERAPEITDLRSPSLLPAETPAEHVAAFAELPLSKH